MSHSSCPFKEKCSCGDGVTPINYRITTLKHEMINKMTQKRYLTIYAERFQTEGVNGYLKRSNGVLMLLGSNKVAATNEINIRNAIYNTIRTRNLKDTIY
ncbi:hypothetical protein MBFIL_12380 [Methanobrevibacter filiformis]|uniref:Transposase DDE domain-containing protein n=1 Tax=Methanobrevibacter filiformis TaxID=55758 RepID=A0A162FEW4_9EURY|nr:hypothetical protein MBFIL_12380 [Methanobrevibacter filiformis]